jgi:hypothetical protein
MPSDLTSTPETEMIRAYVRGLAPDIHEVSCGVRMDGGYDVWLQLLPTSTIRQVVISRTQYKDDQWKDMVGNAIDEANI